MYSTKIYFKLKEIQRIKDSIKHVPVRAIYGDYYDALCYCFVGYLSYINIDNGYFFIGLHFDVGEGEVNIKKHYEEVVLFKYESIPILLHGCDPSFLQDRHNLYCAFSKENVDAHDRE